MIVFPMDFEGKKCTAPLLVRWSSIQKFEEAAFQTEPGFFQTSLRAQLKCISVKWKHLALTRLDLPNLTG